MNFDLFLVLGTGYRVFEFDIAFSDLQNHSRQGLSFNFGPFYDLAIFTFLHFCIEGAFGDSKYKIILAFSLIRFLFRNWPWKVKLILNIQCQDRIN